MSGSSGHLVIERVKEAGQEPDYPGKVFANPDLDYEEAIQAFVQASRPLGCQPKATAMDEKATKRAEIRQLHQAEAQLCVERCAMRKLRKLEDAAWQAAWQKQRSAERVADEALAQTKLHARWGFRKLQDDQRQRLREQRRSQLALRQKEDEQWRLARQRLRERMALLPIVTTWIAVLVATDNCSRQCLGLPLFETGSHVTAEVVVAALRALLPADLQFLISDRGTHFAAQVFRQLATEANFIHVVIARHRPQSNGIAERFVRTIKEWLVDKAWTSDQDLRDSLHTFLLEYNDRPHQGLPIPGLSPNEYAKRLWLF